MMEFNDSNCMKNTICNFDTCENYQDSYQNHLKVNGKHLIIHIYNVCLNNMVILWFRMRIYNIFENPNFKLINIKHG